MDKNIINISTLKSQPNPPRIFVDLIDRLIIVNARYDDANKSYELHYDDLNDFDQQELTSIIMSHDHDWGCEASGPDNSMYENYMLPALITYMRDTRNKILKSEFVEAWEKGLTHYFKGYISKALEERLISYNIEKFGDRNE